MTIKHAGICKECGCEVITLEEEVKNTRCSNNLCQNHIWHSLQNNSYYKVKLNKEENICQH